MKFEKRVTTWIAVVAMMGGLLALPVLAQDGEDEKELGWFDTAELSLLMTDGNSEAFSVAGRNTLSHLWDGASFRLDVGAFRAETTTSNRFAVGVPGAFTLNETSATAVTAQNYFVRGQYDRVISERLFWFAGLGWDRNEFAGIKNRATAVGGVGHLWFETDKSHLRTSYGVTFTDQEDVVVLPGASDSFLGARLSCDYGRQLTPTASFSSVLILDENLDDTADLRADFTNSLSAALSDRMALKVSLQMFLDNQPALGQVALFSAPGVATGDVLLLPLDDVDTLLTASLVVNF